MNKAQYNEYSYSELTPVLFPTILNLCLSLFQVFSLNNGINMTESQPRGENLFSRSFMLEKKMKRMTNEITWLALGTST